jgi:hypothetical protein
MKLSIVLLALIVSALCVSCKPTKVQKTSEPKTDLGTIEAVNMDPVKIKTGPIICPKKEKIEFWEGETNTARCTNTAILYNPDKTGIDLKNLGRPLVCPGKITITGKNTGVCNKAN